MDKELEQFQADLLQSVRQMKTGAAVKITKVEIPAAAEARAKVGMSQNDFAALMGVSKRTLQEWEQGNQAMPAYLLDLLDRVWTLEREN